MAKIETLITAKDTSSRAFGSFGSSLSSMGNSIVVANQALEVLGKVTRAVIAPMQAVVSEGASFEKQMSAVASISKEAEKRLVELTDKAREIGATTAFSAAEAASAMEVLARAGQNVDQVMGTTKQAMDLAAATGSELADAAELVAIQMKIFEKQGLSAKDAVNLITKTTGASAQGFEHLNQALKTSAGVAAAMGMEFGDLTVILGAMAEQGVRGERAGTALNGMINRLINPVGDAAKALKKYGITLDEINPSTNDFADILDTLKDKQITNADLLKIVGQEAGPKFIAMIKKGGDSLRDFTEKQKLANDAQAAAKIRLDNLAGATTIFQSTMGELKLTIFDQLKTVLKFIVEESTKIVASFTSWIKGSQSVRNAIAFILEGLADLLDVFAAIINNNGFVAFIDQMVASISGFYTNHLKPLIDNIGEFISAIGKALTNSKAWQDTIETTKRIFKAILDLVVSVAGFITDYVADTIKAVTQSKNFGAAIGAIGKIVNTFLGIGETFITWLKTFFEEATKGSEAIDKTKKSVEGLNDTRVDAFSVENFLSELPKIAERFQQLVNDPLKFMMDGIKADFQLFINDVTALLDWSGISGNFKKFVADPIQFILDILLGDFKAFKSDVQKFFDFSGLSINISDMVKESTGLKDIGKNINDGIKDIKADTIDAVATSMGKVKEAAVSVKTKLDDLSTGFWELTDAAIANVLEMTGNSVDDSFIMVGEAADGTTKKIDKLTEGMDESTKSGGKLSEGAKKASKALRDKAKRIREVADALRNQIKVEKSAATAVGAATTGAAGSTTERTVTNQTKAVAFDPKAAAQAAKAQAASDAEDKKFSDFTGNIGSQFAAKVKGGSGAMQGMAAGGPMGAAIGAIAEIALSSKAFSAAFAKLSEVIGTIFEPLFEALVPVLDLVAEVLVELGPLLVELVPLIKLMIPPLKFMAKILVESVKGVMMLIQGIKFLATVALIPIIAPLVLLKTIMEKLSGHVEPLTNAIKTLADFIKKLAGIMDPSAAAKKFGNEAKKQAGGAGRTVEHTLKNARKKLFGRAEGGVIQPDQLLKLPGMEPGSGILKAHAGETIGNGSGNNINLTFNVKALDPMQQKEEIRQVIEDLFLTRKLAL